MTCCSEHIDKTNLKELNNCIKECDKNKEPNADITVLSLENQCIGFNSSMSYIQECGKNKASYSKINGVVNFNAKIDLSNITRRQDITCKKDMCVLCCNQKGAEALDSVLEKCRESCEQAFLIKN